MTPEMTAEVLESEVLVRLLLDAQSEGDADQQAGCCEREDEAQEASKYAKDRLQRDSLQQQQPLSQDTTLQKLS